MVYGHELRIFSGSVTSTAQVLRLDLNRSTPESGPTPYTDPAPVFTPHTFPANVPHIASATGYFQTGSVAKSFSVSVGSCRLWKKHEVRN